MRKIILILALLGETALAQTVTIGSMPVRSSGTQSVGAIPTTFIDDSHPASANGTLDRITVRWIGPTDCPNSIRIKVFRYSFGDLFVVADRGPFPSVPGYTSITLTPGIPVNAGDLIGITQLQPVSCGGVAFTDGPPYLQTITLNTNPSLSTFVSDANVVRGRTPAVFGWSGTEYLGAVIPVGGSVAGANGSQFITSLQLTNPERAGTLTGRIVIHPARQSASASDKSIPITIPERATFSYHDLGFATGFTGLGSIDVFVTSGGPPYASARIHEVSKGGTLGFVEDGLQPQQILTAGESATLQFPTELAKYRMNVGVRSMQNGATLQVTVWGPNSLQVGSTITKQYPVNYFDQVSLATFLNNVPAPESGFMSVQVTAGSAIVYATTTDNITNDSSIQIGRRP